MAASKKTVDSRAKQQAAVEAIIEELAKLETNDARVRVLRSAALLVGIELVRVDE